ncbi:hypothetical protein N7447_005817 [Penicillium robsamsonii]|uniref:uncharacterized protein n=1 Tax=Penicillium robsamsonii TaxID=1792511 RepID=UPI00254671EF|nr:uncharacterized protein N7447_005817 [Penicillium robsamsonii]KAJ5823477.1 hypothetical protein N7447_005817 [Penicillium robsamsonii]
MANTSDEEADSRTALVGAPRTRSNPRSTSRSASHDSTRPAKRQRRSRNKKDSDLTDFVPKGVAFSASPLPVDPDSTSSSGSSSASAEDSDSDADPTTTANPHAGSTAPAISWNQGRKAAVRTTLGKRSAPTNEKPTQFEAVNDKYWRSRSESVASANGEEKPKANDKSDNDDELEDGEIDSKSDTDDSDSLGSEADDSILLNIGDKMEMDGANNYDPATLAHQHASNTGDSNMKGGATQSGPGSKEEAFQLFSSKYPNAPTALVDLSQTDLEILANFLSHASNVKMRAIWPTSAQQKSVNTAVPGISIKAVLAPTGDDAKDAANVATTSRNATQSYAISHPKCPVTTVARSTWNPTAISYGSSQPEISTPNKSRYQSAVRIVAGIDPDMITNLNTVIPPQETRPPSQSQSRKRVRDWKSPSPDDDDMMSRVSRGRGRPVPAPRGNTRGKGLPEVVQRSLETTIAHAPQILLFHGVLHHEVVAVAVAEAVDHEEEDSHVDHAAAVEAAGGKKGLFPDENWAEDLGEHRHVHSTVSTIPLSLD